MDLMPEFYIGDLRVDDYPYAVVRGSGGLDLGTGENIMAVVDSMLADGEVLTSPKTSNRTLTLPLYVEGADLRELSMNEEALIRACEQPRNTFTLNPGDGYAAPTVFDTFRIQPVHRRNDDEESALMRRWDLQIPALPWARSASLTTITTSSITTSGLFTLDIGGSVRTEASIKVKAAGTALMEHILIYTDPAMVEYGYNPGTPATWPNAPAGRYVVWMNLPGVTGDLLTATLGTQAARTRLGTGVHNWEPIGTLDLGGRRDGTVGPVSIVIKRNGTTVTTPTLRLFRQADDTALTYLGDTGTGAASSNEVILDAPSPDLPQGGLWGDGNDLLDIAQSWGRHVLPVGEAGLYVAGHANSGAAFTTTVDYYKRGHSYVAEE